MSKGLQTYGSLLLILAGLSIGEVVVITDLFLFKSFDLDWSKFFIKALESNHW